MAIQPGKKERENLWRLLKMAREEDLGDGGDVTSSLLPHDTMARGLFRARQPMVICGAALLEMIALGYDGQLHTAQKLDDGCFVEDCAVLAEWNGPARAMMAAERVALNFVQRLCGIATTTRQYVEAVAGTNAEIYDTRKTTPAWRELEKYAVRAGGGKNHRRGLYDAVLVKDNHLAVLAKASGGDPMTTIAQQLQRVKPYLPERAFVELEVDTLQQFELALTLPVDIIMLDNMTTDQLRTAVRMRGEAGLSDQI
ncbi:MAG: carboxylating nicotinate-nucleotide diphosphorylase, partial [Planctomycetota bacterium]